jgi:hypothetical protein
MVPGASPGSIRANSSLSRPSLTQPTGKRLRPHVKHSCQTGLSAHQRLAPVLSRSARPGAWREEDLGGAMNLQPTMRTARIKRAVMPRAMMANAFYASVHDALEPLSERGRVAVRSSRRFRQNTRHYAKGRGELCFAKRSLLQLLRITAVDSQCDGLDAEKPGF